VLDDSTDETQQVAPDMWPRYAALGAIPSVTFTAPSLRATKAGALDAGLNVAKGEFVAHLSTPILSRHGWIMKVIHHFAEPGIGMVQTRWSPHDRNYRC